MSFHDVLKDSFLSGYITVDLSLKKMVLILVITGLLGMYLYLVYRIANRKSVYSKSFNMSLVAMAVITAAIIITIQISVVVSLGMVGALSIVRFRTAVKDPMDLVFLFWAISVGIMCGAGQYLLAVIVCIGLTILVLALECIPAGKAPMVLVIHAERRLSEQTLGELLSQYCNYHKIKSRSVKNDLKELVIELKTGREEELMDAITQMDGVGGASLLAHEGEVTY